MGAIPLITAVTVWALLALAVALYAFPGLRVDLNNSGSVTAAGAIAALLIVGMIAVASGEAARVLFTAGCALALGLLVGGAERWGLARSGYEAWIEGKKPLWGLLILAAFAAAKILEWLATVSGAGDAVAFSAFLGVSAGYLGWVVLDRPLRAEFDRQQRRLKAALEDRADRP